METKFDFKLLFLILLLTHQSLELSLETGKTYKYSYETTIYFNELNTPRVKQTQKDVGFRVTAELEVTPVFHAGETQLVKLEITKAYVSSAARSGLERNLVVLLKYPIYFEFNHQTGIVGTVYGSGLESTFCSNVKKGVISLFQLREEDGERHELDVSGECDTTYMVSGTSVTKTKNNCKNLEIAGQFSNPNKMFGVSITSTSTAKYELGDGVVGSVSGTERHIVVLNAKPGVSTVVTSTQKMNLLSTTAGAKTLSAGTIEEAVQQLKKAADNNLDLMLLGSGAEIQHCIENCEKPIDVLGKVKDSLSSEKLSTVESGKAFLRLLRSLRGTGKNTIEDVLTSSDSYYIIPQLIDVAIAAQTPDSHKAMMNLVSFDTDTATEYPERLLLALAYTTHPDKFVLEHFLELSKKELPSPVLQESVALALGALVHTYCQDLLRCGDQVIADYMKSMLEGLKTCKDDTCRLRFIRSMGNAGLQDFVFELIHTAESSRNPMVSITALQALRRFPKDFLSQIQKSALRRIFHQNEKKYDSSVRIAAGDVLLQNSPSTGEVVNMLLSAGNQRDHETSTYIVKRLLDMAANDNEFRSQFKQILSDSRINNYFVLAQKGKSSAFSSYLMATREMNSSYGLYQENARNGVMKRSSMIVNMAGKTTNQPLLTFGLYAEGLAALIGEEVEEGSESDEATAGMSLTLMDVLLRPVEFFRGSGELMSAVWNAPSDPVSALQANILLQDHAQKFHLSNGLIVDLEVLGVASFDLSGSVSISLWYKTSNSMIRNSGALVIEGSLKLDSDILKAGITMSAESKAHIDFLTDVEFSDMPFKMCLRMTRPAVLFRQTVEKYERSKHIKKRYRTKQNRATSSPGVNYLINEKNSIQCKTVELP